MDLKCSFTLEVFKNDSNKYIFCIIKIAKRPTKYFFGQNEEHFTHRWVQPQHWAAFDAKIHELVTGNTFEKMKWPFSVYLIESVFMKVSKTNIAIDLLCKTISNYTISPADVSIAIECELEYHEADPNHDKYKVEIKEHIEKVENENQSPSKNLRSSERSSQPTQANITFRKNQTEHCSKNERNDKIVDENATESTQPFQLTPESSDNKTDFENSTKSSLDDTDVTPRNLRRRTINRKSEISPKDKLKHGKLKESKHESHVTEKKFDIFNCVNSEECESMNIVPPTPCKKMDSKKTVGSHIEDNNEVDPIDLPFLLEETPAKRIKKSPAKTKCFSDTKNDNKTGSKRKNPIVITDDDSSEDYFSSSLYLKHIEKSKALSNGKLETPQKTGNFPPFIKNRELALVGTSKKESKNSSSKKNKHNTTHSTPKPIADSIKTNSAKKKKTSNKSDNIQETRSMNDWLSKKTPPNNEEEKPSGSRNRHRRHNSKQSPTRREEKKRQKEPSTSDKRRILSPTMECTVPKIKNLDIMKLQPDEIIQSFEEYKPILETLFDEFEKKPRYKWNNGVNHFTVMELLPHETQLQMMNKLSGHYELKREGAVTYAELFSMVLMPEWVLRLFMKQHNKTREEAIEYINAQKEYKIRSQTEIKFEI